MSYIIYSDTFLIVKNILALFININYRVFLLHINHNTNKISGKISQKNAKKYVLFVVIINLILVNANIILIS